MQLCSLSLGRLWSAFHYQLWDLLRCSEAAGAALLPLHPKHGDPPSLVPSNSVSGLWGFLWEVIVTEGSCFLPHLIAFGLYLCTREKQVSLAANSHFNSQ